MNTVSPGQGPEASIPSARAAATAGAITSRSSRPNMPFSPACGFSPATATRGSAIPKDRVAACARRIARISASGVTARTASASDRWIDTSSTRSSSLASIMAKSAVPVRSARISVCPG